MRPLADPWKPVLRAQVLVWIALGLVYFVLDQGRNPGLERSALLFRAAGWAFVGGAVSSGLVLLYRKLAIETRPWPLVVGVVAGCLPVGAFLWLAAFTTLDGLVEFESDFLPISHWPLEHIFAETTDTLLMLLAWHGIAFTLLQARLAEAEREHALRARALAADAQIARLRHQLSPHFLFNSLNSAMALIDEDPARAEAMLGDLARLLRDALEHTQSETLSLGEELAFVGRYVGLERTRFEEKLEFEEEVPDDVRSARIPSLLLQPLVENAVKHGMTTSEMPLRVRIGVTRESHGLVVTVRNSGHLVEPPSSGPGLGLHLVQERLAVERGRDTGFRLFEEGEWVVAEVSLGSERAP